MTEYYDLVLGLIPLAFLGLGGGLHFAGFALTSALSIGGLFAVGLVGHALFVNGPVSMTEQTQSNTKQQPLTTAE